MEVNQNFIERAAPRGALDIHSPARERTEERHIMQEDVEMVSTGRNSGSSNAGEALRVTWDEIQLLNTERIRLSASVASCHISLANIDKTIGDIIRRSRR
jgi:hypothetical protein